MRAFDRLTERGRWGRLRALAVAAAAEFPDVRPDSVRLLHGGWNTMFQALDDTGARYALRVARVGLDADQVAGEILWLDALARDTDLAVTVPVRARDGRAVVTATAPGVPQPRHCTLYRWLPGREHATRPSPRMMHAVGAFTARLHAHAAGWQPPVGFSRPTLDSMWWGEPDLSPMPASTRAALRAAEVELAPILRRLFAEPLRVIHADLHQRNYRFQRGLRVAALDFDDCGWGHPIQDLGITQYYLQNKPEVAALRGAHRAGYETVAPWPEPFDGALDALVAHRCLTLSGALVEESDANLRALIPKVAPLIEARLARWRDTGSCFA